MDVGLSRIVTGVHNEALDRSSAGSEGTTGLARGRGAPSHGDSETCAGHAVHFDPFVLQDPKQTDMGKAPDCSAAQCWAHASAIHFNPILDRLARDRRQCQAGPGSPAFRAKAFPFPSPSLDRHSTLPAACPCVASGPWNRWKSG